ncbi:P-loop NTPase [archaeon]|nr:P-loop NTPase [archaeon]
MTRIIACVSGKGGAGKTTLVANLGIALARLHKNVVVVDTNISTPNLGLHLGVPFYPITLHDVLKGTARIKDAIYEHESGLRIIPAGISLKDLRGADPKHLPNTLLDLLGDAEIILLDVAAGLGREALSAIETADEIILITNPEVTAVTDALKTAKLAQQIGTKVSGVVINRVTSEKHEMKIEDVMSMLGDYNLLSIVPEDMNVQKAIARRTPVVHHKPRSAASREINDLAMKVAGENYNNYFYHDSWYKRAFSFLR